MQIELGHRPQPIIIMGMHRSGTSLLTHLLTRSGIFLGKSVEDNNESRFFKKLNTWMFRQANCSWDNPSAFRFVHSNAEVLAIMAKHIGSIFESPASAEYWGWKRRKKLGIGDSGGTGWGWKDPVNVYTLPIWLEIFPEAKVLYIERHGVDVAASLVRRSLRSLSAGTRRNVNQSPLSKYRIKQIRLSDSLRCQSMEGAFSLWEEYIDQGRRVIETISSESKIVLKYEDLLLEPSKMAEVLDFCEVQYSNSEYEEIVRPVLGSRAYSYRAEPEALDFSRSVSLRLRGYISE